MVPGAGLPAVVCMILSFDTHVQPSGPELQLLLVVLALLVVLVLPDEFGVAGGIGVGAGVGVASDVGAACGDVGAAVAGIGGVYDGSQSCFCLLLLVSLAVRSSRNAENHDADK